MIPISLGMKLIHWVQEKSMKWRIELSFRGCITDSGKGFCRFFFWVQQFISLGVKFYVYLIIKNDFIQLGVNMKIE